MKDKFDQPCMGKIDLHFLDNKHYKIFAIRRGNPVYGVKKKKRMENPTGVLDSQYIVVEWYMCVEGGIQEPSKSF